MMDKVKLYKDLIRYGRIIKDINFNKNKDYPDGTDRILIFTYNHEVYYTHLCIGNIMECHKIERELEE